MSAFRFVPLLLFVVPLWSQTLTTQESERDPLVEQLVVTATREERPRHEVPAGIAVISEEALRASGAVDPGDALTGVPGLFFRRRDAADSFMDVTIRGLTGNHGNDTFLALLDGIPFVSAHEEVLLGEIPFGAVARVEVVRGPASALYGRGALSGAINYLTREPDAERRIDFDIGADHLGYRRPHVSANIPIVADTNTLLVDGYYEQNDGWREATGRETTNILVKNEWIASPTTKFMFYLNAYRNDQEAGGQLPLDNQGRLLPTAGGRRGFVGYEPNQYTRESLMATARLHQQVGERGHLQLTLNHRDMQDENDLNFYDPFGFDPDNDILRVNGFANQRATNTTFIEPQFTWNGDKHRVIIGADYEHITLDETNWWSGQNGFDEQTFDYHFYEININYRTGEIVNRDHPLWVTRQETYRGDSTNRFVSLFFQHEVGLTENLELIWGARYDRFKRRAAITSDVDFDGVLDVNPTITDDEHNLAPKLALSYALRPSTRLYLSYGEGFNANFAAVWQWDPSLYQRGDAVKPSRVRSYELGLKSAGGAFTYEAALYHMTQTNRLVFLPNPDGFGPAVAANADEFRSQGFELSTRLRLGRGFHATSNLSLIDAAWQRYQAGDRDLAGKRPTGVPKHQFSLGLHGKFGPRWIADLWVEHHGDYAVTLDNRVIGGGYQLVNTHLGYKTDTGTFKGLSLVGRNLLDETYADLFGATDPQTAQPGLPARVYLTLDFAF